jgi:hypothetical protein
VLAAHRGTADAAGVDWKSAVYRKVKEEMNAGRGLTVERMMQLGRVSRASFYRFDENAHPSHDADMDLRDAVLHTWGQNGKVTFRSKDYAHKSKQTLMTVTAEEFLRRFLFHTLPRSFVHIRFCDFLANRCCGTALPLCQALLRNGSPRVELPPANPADPCVWLCPCCGGPMTVIEKLTAQQIRRRSAGRESFCDTS